MNSRILKHPPLGRARVQRAVQYYLPTSAGILHVTLEKWGTRLSMDVEAQSTLPIAKRQRVNIRNQKHGLHITGRETVSLHNHSFPKMSYVILSNTYIFSFLSSFLYLLHSTFTYFYLALYLFNL